MHKWGIHEQKCQLFFHKKNVLYVFLFMYFLHWIHFIGYLTIVSTQNLSIDLFCACELITLINNSQNDPITDQNVQKKVYNLKKVYILQLLDLKFCIKGK